MKVYSRKKIALHFLWREYNSPTKVFVSKIAGEQRYFTRHITKIAKPEARA